MNFDQIVLQREKEGMPSHFAVVPLEKEGNTTFDDAKIVAHIDEEEFLFLKCSKFRDD